MPNIIFSDDIASTNIFYDKVDLAEMTYTVREMKEDRKLTLFEELEMCEREVPDKYDFRLPNLPSSKQYEQIEKMRDYLEGVKMEERRVWEKILVVYPPTGE